MSDLTIVLVTILSIGILAVSRKYVVPVLIVAACFIPVDQRVIVSGLDMTTLRILLAVAVLRLFARGEYTRVQWNDFDGLVLAWAICGAVIYSLQWMSAKAVVNRCGMLVDVLGMYWLFRQTIRSWADIRQVAMIFAVCAIALVPLVAWEWMTGSNPFNLIGHVTTLFRSQHYRCSAAFPHSIMLGVFWAAIVPLFMAFVMLGRDRVLFCTAIAACVFIVAATASSTPVVTLAIAVVAMGLYKWRRFAPAVSLAVVAILVGLHFAMQAPVWHLLARINVVSGSTGWYRFYLLDQAITHFSEWAALGCRDTESWGMGLGDVTNQYVLEGVRGGMLTLILFLAVLFVGAGRLLRTSLREEHPQKQLIVCSVLAMLVTHCSAFGAVSYFGQMNMEWYMVLAMIGVMVEWQTAVSRSQARAGFAQPQEELAGA